MARIAGVDLPREKRVEVGLTYIYGVGRSTARKICRDTEVDPDTKVRDLAEGEVARVRTYIDQNGNVIAWESAGSLGFKGSRKSTPFAAQMTAESVANKAMDQGVRRVDIEVKGHGSGRDMAARTFQSMGIEVLSIKDVTGQPHNGCRPPKRRRG